MKFFKAFNWTRFVWAALAVVAGLWLKEQLFSGELMARIKGITGQN